MTDPNSTHLVLVVDSSSSMRSICKEAKDTLNNFVTEQRKVPGKATVTYAHFASKVETVFDNVPLDTVGEIPLEPMGMTALNDAFGMTIDRVGRGIAALPEHKRPGKVLFILVTDGFENASREYSKATVKKLVHHQQEKYSWDFVFVGANQDAILAGAEYGINRDSTLSFNANANGTYAVGAAMNTYATSTRSGLAGAFTEQERLAAVANK